jgi:hypothetical protein
MLTDAEEDRIDPWRLASPLTARPLMTTLKNTY